MENILFIVKSYNTHSRPNAMCVELISEYINKDKINIDYISIEDSDIEARELNVIPIYVKHSFIKRYRFLYELCKFVFAPVSDIKLVKEIYDCMCIQTTRKKYDMIIAVCNPPEIVEALYRLKKKYASLNTVIYEIDSNSNRYKKSKKIVEKYMNFRAYIWERRMYQCIDKIIHMKSHKQHYESSKFNGMRNKFIYSDIPYYIPLNNFNIKRYRKKGEAYRLIYAGAFYPELRNPLYMIQCVSKLSEKLDVCFDIYTGNKMRTQVNKWANLYGQNIYVHDEISQNELLKEFENSDVLISVGNKNSDFLPSKILFYMSTGKKIIHFYPEGDVALPYLKKYPNSYLVNQKDKLTDEVITRIIEFIIKDEERIDMTQLSSVFEENTPLYSAKKIEEVLECFMEENRIL